MMKQKYVISFSPNDQQLSLRELAQIERDSYSLLCEEIFDVEAVAKAAQSGKEQLVDMLRTKNMYPPATYSEAIAQAILDLLKEKDGGATELVFDDKEIMAKEQPQEPGPSDMDGDAASAIDPLLEDK